MLVVTCEVLCAQRTKPDGLLLLKGSIIALYYLKSIQ